MKPASPRPVAFLLLAAALTAVPPAHGAAQQPGRLVIIGGGLSRENEAVYRAILDARAGSGPLCIIPTAAATPATAMAGPVANFDRFGGAGTAQGVLVAVGAPESARDPNVVAQIGSCSGFFFVGGVQSRVINAFLPNGERTPALEALLQRFRDGAVVSGSSAGAAIMSDPMIAGGSSAGAIAGGVRRVADNASDDDDSGAVAISRGIGFFPHALVDQHFLARGRIGRLIVAIDELAEFDLGFGIDENTALAVEGTQVWTVGASGVIVLDAQDARRDGRNLSGVRLHLLGTGDRYDVATRTITIDARKQVLPVDGARVTAPEDVFARWQFLQLLHAFARSAQSEIRMSITGGELVLRKTASFAAKSLDAAGVQNTPAGLTVTGLELQLRRQQ